MLTDGKNEVKHLIVKDNEAKQNDSCGVVVMEDVSYKEMKDKYIERINAIDKADKLNYADAYAKNKMQLEPVVDENGEPVMNSKGNPKMQPKTYTDPETGKEKVSYSHMQSISSDTLKKIQEVGKSYSDDKGNTYYSIDASMKMGNGRQAGQLVIDPETIQTSTVDKDMNAARVSRQMTNMHEIVEAKNARTAEFEAAEKAAKNANLSASASKSAPEAPAKDSAEKGLGE